MPLNVGLVGCGNVGRNRHVPNVRAHPDAHLVAVCDTDPDAVAAVEAETGATGYTDLDEMLDAEDLDVVHLGTPPQTHLDLGLVVIEHGIPLLIEKPAATSAAAVEELETAAESAGVPVTVVHNRLFEPTVRRATRLVEAGAIGDPVAVSRTRGRQVRTRRYAGTGSSTFPAEASVRGSHTRCTCRWPSSTGSTRSPVSRPDVAGATSERRSTGSR